MLVRFKNQIDRNELQYFRGAVINNLGKQGSDLFHNHIGDNYRYSYPLIQYKRINKCAAILCINEGTEAIGDMFANANFDFMIAEREIIMEIDTLKAYQTLIQTWQDTFEYQITNWIPLNKENYNIYKNIDVLSEKLFFLEKILIGNILSFCKGVDITLEHEIECHILNMKPPRLVNYKGVKLMSFNIDFKCNVSLPNYIGLGKNVSLGNGIVTKIIKNNKDE